MQTLEREIASEELTLEPRLMPDELAQRWNITTKTLANMRALCSGPAYVRVGAGGPNSNGRIIYLVRDICAYEEANRQIRRAS